MAGQTILDFIYYLGRDRKLYHRFSLSNESRKLILTYNIDIPL